MSSSHRSAATPKADAGVFSLTEVDANAVPQLPSARPQRPLTSHAHVQQQSYRSHHAAPEQPQKPVFRSRTPPRKVRNAPVAVIPPRRSKAPSVAASSSAPQPQPQPQPQLSQMQVQMQSQSQSSLQSQAIEIPRVPLSALREPPRPDSVRAPSVQSPGTYSHSKKPRHADDAASMVSGSSYYSDWDDATSVVTASTNTRARIEDLERSLNYERQQREETEKRLRELQERQDQIMRELDRNNGRSSHPQSYAPTNSGRDTLTGRLRRAEDDLALLRMSMHSQEADMMLDDALEGTAYVNRPISRTKYITDYRGCLLPSHF